MPDPWQQQPGESDDEYKAWLSWYSSRVHAVDGLSELVDRTSDAHTGRRFQHDWDARADATDAELLRRRAMHAVETVSLAAVDLVSLAAAAVHLADKDGDTPDSAVVGRLTGDLAAGIGLMRDAVELSRVADRLPAAGRGRGNETAAEGRESLSLLPAEPEPADHPEHPAEPEPADHPEHPAEPEPADHPEHPAEPEPDRAAVSSPKTNGRHRLGAPTITERCGKRGGQTDHRNRGERNCELCDDYLRSAAAAADTADDDPGPPAVIYTPFS